MLIKPTHRLIKNRPAKLKRRTKEKAKAKRPASQSHPKGKAKAKAKAKAKLPVLPDLRVKKTSHPRGEPRG